MQNVPGRWQNVTEICLKNLLQAKKRSSLTISFQFFHFLPKWQSMTKKKFSPTINIQFFPFRLKKRSLLAIPNLRHRRIEQPCFQSLLLTRIQ